MRQRVEEHALRRGAGSVCASASPAIPERAALCRTGPAPRRSASRRCATRRDASSPRASRTPSPSGPLPPRCAWSPVRKPSWLDRRAATARARSSSSVGVPHRLERRSLVATAEHAQRRLAHHEQPPAQFQARLRARAAGAITALRGQRERPAGVAERGIVGVAGSACSALPRRRLRRARLAWQARSARPAAIQSPPRAARAANRSAARACSAAAALLSNRLVGDVVQDLWLKANSRQVVRRRVGLARQREPLFSAGSAAGAPASSARPGLVPEHATSRSRPAAPRSMLSPADRRAVACTIPTRGQRDRVLQQPLRPLAAPVKPLGADRAALDSKASSPCRGCPRRAGRRVRQARRAPPSTKAAGGNASASADRALGRQRTGTMRQCRTSGTTRVKSSRRSQQPAASARPHLRRHVARRRQSRWASQTRRRRTSAGLPAAAPAARRRHCGAASGP